MAIDKAIDNPFSRAPASRFRQGESWRKLNEERLKKEAEVSKNKREKPKYTSLKAIALGERIKNERIAGGIGLLAVVIPMAVGSILANRSPSAAEVLHAVVNGPAPIEITDNAANNNPVVIPAQPQESVPPQTVKTDANMVTAFQPKSVEVMKVNYVAPPKPTYSPDFMKKNNSSRLELIKKNEESIRNTAEMSLPKDENGEVREDQKGYIVKMMDLIGDQFINLKENRSPDDFKRSAAYQPMIDEVARGMGADQEIPTIVRLLPGVILTESRGIPNAVSKDGARGLTQIMPDNVEKIREGLTERRTSFEKQVERAKKTLSEDPTNTEKSQKLSALKEQLKSLQAVYSKLKIQEDRKTGKVIVDLNDPYTNLVFSMEHFLSQQELFGDEVTVLENYYLGLNNTIKVISKARGLPQKGDDLVSRLAKYDTSKPAIRELRELIKGNEKAPPLNLVNILNALGGRDPGAKVYALRILAAKVHIDNLK